MRNLLLTVTSVIWARLGSGCNTWGKPFATVRPVREQGQPGEAQPRGPRTGRKCEQAPSGLSNLCRWLPLSGTQFLYL